MKLLLIGYGKMGAWVKEVATERGHECVIIDPKHSQAHFKQLNEKSRKGMEVAIDFSSPDAAASNIETAAQLNLPIVVGTTGWAKSFPKIEKLVQSKGASLLYGANFSIGMNLTFQLAAIAAKKFSQFPEYDVGGFEIHHRQKQDIPSGTALRLSEVVTSQLKSKRKVQTQLTGKLGGQDIHFSGLRVGYDPGMHLLVFDSEVDSIEIIHRTRSRKEFAIGAVRAAEWLKGKKGIFRFEDRFEEFQS